MERRFTFKDFSLFAFMTLLFVTVLLSMYMVDRQWEKMTEMQRTMEEQAGDLRELRETIRSVDQRIRSAPRNLSLTEKVDETASAPSAFQRATEASRKADFAHGDWRVTAFNVGLKTITPLVSADAYAADVQSYAIESLIARNPETLEWEGLIAKDWHVSDDGLTFTFQLRNDVRFSDGQPLEASDVEFTFSFIMNETIAAPRSRAFYEKIERVSATDKYQVVFTFKEPYFNSLSLAGGIGVLPRHFYEPYLSEPEKFNQSKGLLLGSGPYRLKDPTGWSPDKGFVELERNPRYWGPVLPAFDRLIWKVIENDSARLTTFRNGEIDTYSARPVEYRKLLQDDELTARTQNFEYMSPTAGYSYIGWNQKRNEKPTRFADKRVRQAMTYLADRQRIIDEIFLGYAEAAISPFNPRSKQHAPELTPREFNLEKAQQLLTEAGYADRDGDGILEDGHGEKFEFELVYFQDNEDTKRMVLFLKDLYGRAGVLLKPKPTEWAVLIDLIKKQDFEAITLGWTSGIETDIYQMFHGSQAIPGGDNFVNYRNKKLDTLIEQARATVVEDQRMPLWQECERILHEDQPYTFLMRRKSLIFVDRRIQNLEITKLGLNVSAVPVEIYVPAALQRYTP